MKISLSLSIIILSVLSVCNISAKKISLLSPDKNIELKIAVDEKIAWSVLYKGELLLKECTASMTVDDNKILGYNSRLKNSEQTFINQIIKAIVPVKSSSVEDKCNQVELTFKGDFSLIFRVYDNGIAYRFKTNYKNTITVYDEELNIRFNGEYISYFPEEETILSHFERTYKKINIDSLTKDQFCSLPVYFKNMNNKSILFTEADLIDYPGMFLTSNGENCLHSKFPKYILEIKPADDSPERNETIVKEAEYIAKINGTRCFPWRVFTIAENDKDIVQSNLVYQLSSPSQLKQTDWIKPGKVAWDWWNYNNIYGVDFKSGINTATYKYYIDFASEFNLNYIILDEGWSKSSTIITESNPEIDVKELIAYGKEKNVGIILWTLWKPLDKDLNNVLDTYKEWGAKGIKVDFMQRLDQYMVNYYEKVAKAAAERELLVDFHGGFKPAGLNKTYPNVLSFEGVKGLEHNKWSEDVTPEHDVTIPFVRMVAGPMDYTPGAMDNSEKENFFIRYSRPMSMGTRTHQIALYVVFESPIQMLADNPTNYYKERECTDFISRIPTIWDETIVLNGKIGEYIAVARKNGDKWYIGALTDWTEREMELDLSFLKEGNYKIEIFQDGINANRNALDYKRTQSPLDSKKIKIKMARGGGWAAIVSNN